MLTENPVQMDSEQDYPTPATPGSIEPIEQKYVPMSAAISQAHHINSSIIATAASASAIDRKPISHHTITHGSVSVSFRRKISKIQFFGNFGITGL